MSQEKELSESVNPIESTALTVLVSCEEYDNELACDKNAKTQDQQKGLKLSLKQKAQDIHQPHIHNYFTRIRNNPGTVGETVESTSYKGNQGLLTDIALHNWPPDPAIKSTQSEQAQNEPGGAAGTDSSLDASLIEELTVGRLRTTRIISMVHLDLLLAIISTPLKYTKLKQSILALTSELPCSGLAVHIRDSQRQSFAETHQKAPSQSVGRLVQELRDTC
ncbi:hypothetical protein NDU88_001892 [Pleurodeles waltl]|uniref:Uncharacterized protein n=1 Tax=Pleurodeles waltl TaxID=8319 RepID=A0AAV7LZX5_PLEWA|nr:hypothetical protein NDU88_001892 [Pleurodeles waltl]